MSTKNEQWQKITTEVDEAIKNKDPLIDRNMREVVIVLRTADFPVCAAHYGYKTSREMAPWIDVEITPPLDKQLEISEVLKQVRTAEEQNHSKATIRRCVSRYESLLNRARKPILEEVARLIFLINNFYLELGDDKAISTDRLIVYPVSTYRYRLSSQGMLTQVLESDTIRKNLLTSYQTEMNQFAKFLKEKLFQ